MKLAIFADGFCRDETAYGLFKIVKETTARWTFERVSGDQLSGHLFNYHKTPWLSKWDARNKAIAWIEDVEHFASIVQAHRDMETALNTFNTYYHEDCSETRRMFITRIGNYAVGEPE